MLWSALNVLSSVDKGNLKGKRFKCNLFKNFNNASTITSKEERIKVKALDTIFETFYI